MLIYEKKVEGTNHIFGTMGNIPAEIDSQLTYKDEYGDVITPSLSDTYLDNGSGGIVEKSSNTSINVFIDDTCVVNSSKDISITKIEITTPPTKVSYKQGEALDLTGMVVTATTSNGNSKIITNYTTSPINGSALSDETKVTVTYKEKTAEQNITVSALSSIAVTTPPTKTLYDAIGVDVDLTGMIVTGTYADTSTKEVTEYTYSPLTVPDGSGSADYTFDVTISYLEKTTTQQLSVYLGE